MAYGGGAEGKDGANFTYMDGVPVKVGEKFKPPRKVTLPVGFHPKIPYDLLSEEYDFSLERNILAHIENQRKEAEAAKAKRLERIAALEAAEEEARRKKEEAEEEEQKLREERRKSAEVEGSSAEETNPDDCDKSDEAIPTSGTSEPEVQVVDKPQSSGSPDRARETHILIPVQVDNCSQPMMPSAGHLPSYPPLNLADFEADTSSPFDNMELKTINDMEELARVLRQPSQYGASGYNNNNNTTTASQVNGFYPHYGQQPQKVNGNNNEGVSVASAYAPTYPPSYSSAYNSYYTPMASTQQYTTAPVTWTVPSTSSYAPPTYSQTSYPQYVPPAYPIPYPNSVASNPIRVSKSVPDLVQELGKEMEGSQGLTGAPLDSQARKTARTPPPRVPARAQTRTGVRGAAKKNDQLPDPTMELGSEERALARRLSEMGFPPARVARACQRLGADDKKVVEHLLLVQSLEELGYPGEQCESALFSHGGEEEAARRHLELLAQFTGLGFSEEKIVHALVSSGNDRDKALDILLS